jgi:tagatose 1,6-diphosphate aldolase
VLLAYEQTGYDAIVRGRLPDLLPAWSVQRLVAAGANAIKVLLYYNAFDETSNNSVKQAFVERIGSECVAEDVPFFLEIVTYDDAIDDEHGLVYALKKPQLVTHAISEFTKSCYRVDVLKVEAPVNLAFVAGTRAFAGREAYSYQEAMRFFREAAFAATKPFIYLSAGVTMKMFLETLELAKEAGVDYAGVLCGRATWQDGVVTYAKQGVAGLEAWLADCGVENITALNTQLTSSAKPWWTIYGGRENIEIEKSGWHFAE